MIVRKVGLSLSHLKLGLDHDRDLDSPGEGYSILLVTCSIR